MAIKGCRREGRSGAVIRRYLAYPAVSVAPPLQSTRNKAQHHTENKTTDIRLDMYPAKLSESNQSELSLLYSARLTGRRRVPTCRRPLQKLVPERELICTNSKLFLLIVWLQFNRYRYYTYILLIYLSI